MSAAPRIAPQTTDLVGGDDRQTRLHQLRDELARRFPGAVQATRMRGGVDPLHRAPTLWVESGFGEGGLAWLAAWTLLALADDPLGRPALWVDTHETLLPGDLLDLSNRLVVVRPADPHEAHVAADIALRTGSFALVALEMHRSLHPTPLGRLARLAGQAAASASNPASPRSRLVLWGEPPPFLAPPSTVPRTPLSSAIAALFGHPRLASTFDPDPSHAQPRALHTTDRMHPVDRVADRRPSSSAARHS